MSHALRRSLLCLAGGLLGVSLVPLSEAADAKGSARPAEDGSPDHPIVPGFERFYAGPKADLVRGGQLLLGELNCSACHEANRALDTRIDRKQAPILDDVGKRVKPRYLRAFLADPHGTKPGTTMPNLFAGLSEEERRSRVEALTHFLASTGGLSDTSPQLKAIDVGRKLYHQVGCVACHGPRERPTARLATSMPLGNLSAKYTISSLATFLKNPLQVRPSGRMPDLSFNDNEAVQVANFLLKDLQTDTRPKLNYTYYEGSWNAVPDLAKETPQAKGRSAGFDLGVARRNDGIALRFEGTLQTERAGRYTFHLTSDDGSLLSIDGKLVVENDAIHAAAERTGVVHLTRGAHPIVVSYFNGSGELELDVEYEGPGVSRQPVASALVPLTNDPRPVADATADQDRFTIDPALAKKGRELFAKVGCASCHQLRVDGTPIATTLAATPLVALRREGGCLDASHEQGGRMYPLSDAQHAALTAALGALGTPSAAPPDSREVVARTLTTYNCFACHRRDGVGGIEEGRDEFFATTQKEMGDEGRIPPALDGVGAKLQADYMRHIFAAGAKDRPYMLTRMPRFGASNVGPLITAFAALDPIAPIEEPTFDLSPRKVKAAGRFLAGGEALGCIKCHTFKGIQAEGVQAIDMTLMTRRLRRDWFHRYLIDPQAYRPGTRMPTAWPMGKTLLPKVLDGDPRKQIEAVWQFLSDVSNAVEPYGLGRDPIPLIAVKEPVLYRNFIQGAGPRAIAVGYPEKADLAFDANDMRIALIWQGAFIDASHHWNGRGEGFQSPLGDNVVSLPAGPSLARLKSRTEAWPRGRARDLGFTFRGYRLDRDQRPLFLYDFGPIHVEDFPQPVAGKDFASLRRSLTLTAAAPVPDLWFRAMAADTIVPASDGWYTIDGEWKMRVEADATPIVRTSEGKAELLVPVHLTGKPARIVQEFVW